MKISDLDQPAVGDIVEFETDHDTVVEGIIVGETEDGYIYEFSDSGYTALNESVKQDVAEGSDIQIPTEDGIGWQDIRLMAGEGKLTQKTIKQAIDIIRKQRTEQSVAEEKTRLDAKCWDGYKKDGTKMKGNTRVNNCVPESAGYIARTPAEAKDPRFSASMTVDVSIDTMRNQLNAFFPTAAPNDGQEQVHEAQYQGREVSLGRPMRGDVKKFKVYVKNKAGKVVKVNFGDPNMRIKKSNPARRKSFRARHNCSTPGPRDKARYWSCRKW